MPSKRTDKDLLNDEQIQVDYDEEEDFIDDKKNDTENETKTSKDITKITNHDNNQPKHKKRLK